MTSKDDVSVPFEHSLMLYHEFKKQGFSNVHLVTISKGKHSFLLQDKIAQPIYLRAVHTFYKKYDLPYDAKCATDSYAPYNPDINSIKHQISVYEAKFQKIIVGHKKWRIARFF